MFPVKLSLSLLNLFLYRLLSSLHHSGILSETWLTKSPNSYIETSIYNPRVCITFARYPHDFTVICLLHNSPYMHIAILKLSTIRALTGIKWDTHSGYTCKPPQLYIFERIEMSTFIDVLVYTISLSMMTA